MCCGSGQSSEDVGDSLGCGEFVEDGLDVLGGLKAEIIGLEVQLSRMAAKDPRNYPKHSQMFTELPRGSTE